MACACQLNQPAATWSPSARADDLAYVRRKAGLGKTSASSGYVNSAAAQDKVLAEPAAERDFSQAKDRMVPTIVVQAQGPRPTWHDPAVLLAGGALLVSLANLGLHLVQRGRV